MTALDDRVREATRRVAKRLNRTPREVFFAVAEQSVSKFNLAPPNQSVNADIIALACALLAVADDVQTFVLDEALLRKFDLLAEFGIDPQPLFHLNAYDSALRRTVKRLLGGADVPIESRYPQLCDALHEILADRLLGAQTPGKMAYVRAITHEPLSQLTSAVLNERLHSLSGIAEPLRYVESRELAQQMIELSSVTRDMLERQLRRLPPDHVKRRPVQEMLEHLYRDLSSADMLRFHLRALLADDPRTTLSFDDFCRDYCDEIVQMIARHADEASGIRVESSWRCVRGQGIELAYASRTMDFLLLGDRYGDCTARRTSKQVDAGIPNIHWTVYSWLLDPFYRVLQVHVDGEPVMKAHLTPLMLDDLSVLAVDAIEVIPSLRDTVLRDTLQDPESSQSTQRPHKFLSTRLFAIRPQITTALFDTVCDIGRRMGVDTILVDKYSNASWVRNAVNALPEEHYHVSSVRKPFGARPLIELSERWTGMSPIETQVEIQAVNLLLMDQGLRHGYKHAGLLWGRPRTLRLPVRGP